MNGSDQSRSNPSEPITLEASNVILEAMECRLADNQDRVLMYTSQMIDHHGGEPEQQGFF